MKKLYISDLKIGDSIFGETFAVKNYKKGATRNNKPFIDIELADNSGAIKGKIWSDDMANAEQAAEGDVVNINATVEDFMGAPQLRITNLTKTEKYDLGDLQQKTNFDIEKMWQDLENHIKAVKNPHLKKLLDNIFTNENIEAFKNSPAAFRVHHAYLGGLLEHTWEMIMMSDALKTHYPKINMDLVICGILLHDFGKTKEFKMGTTIIFNDTAKLLGHVYMSSQIVQENAPKDMPEDLFNEVIHIILSHHGSLEFGSPVLPKTVEAIAVYGLDNASAKMNLAYYQIHGNMGTESFTQYINQLGTELYRSPYLDEDINEDIPF